MKLIRCVYERERKSARARKIERLREKETQRERARERESEVGFEVLRNEVDQVCS